jgi:deoxyribose-phosphate aldolase
MSLTQLIDHTLLKSDATLDDIRKLCSEAIEHQFKAVCIPPYYVAEAVKIFEQVSPRPAVATVVGFPMGYASTAAKVEEIKRAVDEGADEIDAVINICAIKSKQWNYVENDISSMLMAAQMRGKKAKIIIEASLLTEEELKKVADILLATKPDFVKTSTGFHEGATVELVQKLVKLLNNKIPVKASGGIRTREAAEALVQAGAKRIGTSVGLEMLG